MIKIYPSNECMNKTESYGIGRFNHGRKAKLLEEEYAKEIRQILKERRKEQRAYYKDLRSRKVDLKRATVRFTKYYKRGSYGKRSINT